MDRSEAWASMDAGLLKTTGKGMADWVAAAKRTGIDRHKALVDHLKSQGLTHGYANSIALQTFGSHAEAIGDETLLAQMFAGPKVALRPIYDRLVDAVTAFGDDVELAPKKGYVAARRAKQFAIFQPSTRDRFDLGLNLKGVEATGRLEASGSFNAMCSHRVRIGMPDEIDAEVLGWLRESYECAGPK